MRSYLVLDIETVPDLELYSHPEVAQGQERPFPPLHSHRPIVIGVLWLDENYVPKRLGCIGEDKDERGMLQDFSKFCEQHRPHIVTFNGRGFDLPVLSLRCMRQGVPMNFFHSDRDYRYRFSDSGHLDLYDFMSDHGAARVGSLDSLARLIGLPGKVGVDGSQVEGLYNAGQLQAIRNYCLADVTQTAFLLLRYRLLQGLLDHETYRARAQGFIDYFTADGRLAPVLEKIDRRYLMLD